MKDTCQDHGKFIQASTNGKKAWVVCASCGKRIPGYKVKLTMRGRVGAIIHYTMEVRDVR